jgi:hypothetical protein
MTRVCAICGKTVAEHEPAIGVTFIVASDGADYYADELAGRVSPFIAAAFATTPGIGGVRVVYGASCFDERFSATDGETARLDAAKAVRTSVRERVMSPWKRGEQAEANREAMRERTEGMRARIEASRARRNAGGT